MLEINNLQVHFKTPTGEINRAVEGMSLRVGDNETVAIVGESGCGKSVTSMSVLRLMPENAARFGGEILFRGEDLLKKSHREIRKIRGGQIGMIFQEPMTSLNRCGPSAARSKKP